MSNNISNPIKIYHIVHIDKLPSILEKNELLCDATIQQYTQVGTTIGMDSIKSRRLQNPIPSYSDLMVGECVPFYFCPRSIMLYLIHRRNPELTYRGGQEPIIHLVADMHDTINWAEQQKLRWVFTSSNAGAFYFDSYNDLSNLSEIDWDAVNERDWSHCKHEKQAEFLVERCFPWHLVERIGVFSENYRQQVSSVFAQSQSAHRPTIEVKRDWYY